MGPQLDSCGKGKTESLESFSFQASMGPQLDSCGKPRNTALGIFRCTASMGPQLDSCGKGERTAHPTQKPLELQWGRNLTVAESMGRSPWPSLYWWLQWGRNLTVAESRRDLGLRLAGGASMGPQLDSCGKSCASFQRSWAALASMGPQLDSCGKDTSRGSSLLSLNVLQWGRNLTVAERVTPRTHQPSISMLQWGRNLTVAERGPRGP